MISIPKFRAALDLGAKHEGDLQSLLDEVVALWERETRRLWKARAGHVQELNPLHAVRTIYLTLYPVTTLTQVRVRGEGSGTDWTVLTVDDDFHERGQRGIRRVGTYWESRVEVTYDGGYADDAAPADVLKALATQAKFMRQRFAKEQLTTKSENFEGGAGVFEEADLHPFFAAQAKRHGRKS